MCELIKMISVTIFPHTANVSIDGCLISHIEYTTYKTNNGLITFYVNGSESCYVFYDKLEVE